jgi:hypothetical protein
MLEAHGSFINSSGWLQACQCWYLAYAATVGSPYPIWTPAASLQGLIEQLFCQLQTCCMLGKLCIHCTAAVLPASDMLHAPQRRHTRACASLHALLARYSSSRPSSSSSCRQQQQQQQEGRHVPKVKDAKWLPRSGNQGTPPAPRCLLHLVLAGASRHNFMSPNAAAQQVCKLAHTLKQQSTHDDLLSCVMLVANTSPKHPSRTS